MAASSTRSVVDTQPGLATYQARDEEEKGGDEVERSEEPD